MVTAENTNTIETLQFLARFSEILLDNPDNEEVKTVLLELIEKANKIVSVYYQIPTK